MSDSNIINFYQTIKSHKTHNPYYEVHRIKLPFRALVCTASGGGKSNLVLNLLYEMHLTFHKIVICTKAPEPLYDMLKDRLKDKVEISYDTIPELSKMPKSENGIIIFDDMVLDKGRPQIGQMFIRGRKLGYSSIFITQSFFGTPKIIRQNVNYVWIGRGMLRRDLRLILSEYALGISVDELESLYSELTREPMNFMLIDLDHRTLRHNIKKIIKQL